MIKKTYAKITVNDSRFLKENGNGRWLEPAIAWGHLPWVGTGGGGGGGGLKRLKSGLEPVYAIEAAEGSVEISLYSRTCTYGRFSPKHARSP